MNKISKQLLSIAKQIDKIAETIEVDETEHSFDELATWIVSASQEAFQKFLNDNDFERQNFQASNVNVMLQKDFTGIQVQLQPKDKIEEVKKAKEEIKDGAYTATCQAQDIGVVLVTSKIETEKFLPLLRSVPGSYEQNGDLTKEAVKSFRDSLFDIASATYK